MLKFHSVVSQCRSGTLIVLLGILLAGCTTRLGRLPIRAIDAVVPRQGRTYAVLLNGGGRPEINYQSHLQHVRGMVDLLEANNIRPEDIVVFSADGSNPAADLATRQVTADPHAWLLPQATLGRSLYPIVYVNSTVNGARLQPATKEALRAWFEHNGVRLRRGDTLLFYVTDHGHKNAKDLNNNTIVLWGQELSVTELRSMLSLIDEHVRVVMVMSQCYAGAFANEIFAKPDDALPSGNVCGYFASTADRPAYGCYPENRGKDGVGHSYELLHALGPLAGLPEAHRRVLVTDRTPDVPNTSAEFFLDRLLRQKASVARQELTPFVDDLLAEAWKNRAAWEPEIRLLDRIGQTFGSFSPRSLVELEQESQALPRFSKQLSTYAGRWHDALESLKVENMRRFLDAFPQWTDRLKPDKIQALSADARRATAKELLADLAPFTQSATERYARLLSLKQKADEASAASYRAEVRLGAVLRMRAILTDVAGRVYIAQHATPDERDAYHELVACQDLTLVKHPQVATAAQLEPPAPFPPMAEEQKLVESVMPAWMGIRYSPLSESQRKLYDTHVGAVAVTTVYPDSPAASAGLEVGDIIVGTPDAPFKESNEVREWTMRHEIGAPAPVDVLRDKRLKQITLRLAPYPVEVPELPGPPKVGSAAPPLKVDLVRGATRLDDGKPRLLFFWATWCAICKHALPEVLAYGQENNIDVVAISDEDADTQRKFLDSFNAPFPSIVATDPLRVTLQSYGVSGTPTFVLVDGKGIVRYYQTGYTSAMGLGIDGWHWDPPKKAAN